MLGMVVQCYFYPPDHLIFEQQMNIFLQDPFLSVLQLWQIHVAEQMVLDDLEANPDKYKGKRLSELTDDDDYDEENNVQYTKAYYKKSLLPKMILVSLFFLNFILTKLSALSTC